MLAPTLVFLEDLVSRREKLVKKLLAPVLPGMVLSVDRMILSRRMSVRRAPSRGRPSLPVELVPLVRAIALPMTVLR